MVGFYQKNYRALSILFVALPISFASNFLGITSAAGSTANGFSISPLVSYITVDKGQTTSFSINVGNPTGATLTAAPQADDFVAAGESGAAALIVSPKTPKPANDFSSLVSGLSNLTIPPGGQQTLNFTISVPRDANSGGYYGAIRFVPVFSSTNKGVVGLTASVGSLVLLTVPGNLIERLSLIQLSAAQNGQANGLFVHGNLSVLMRLENEGNIYAQPYGTVQVSNMDRHIINVQQFNNTSPRESILEGSTRKFTLGLPKYHWLGRYTITASISYGNSQSNLIVAKANFWYLPTWFIITAVVAIAIIIFLIYWITKKIKNIHVKKIKLKKRPRL